MRAAAHIASMSFQNGHVESALARACLIPPDGIGAFRGRLRHLRSLGIPKVQKVGSGNRVRLSRSDVLTMRLALEFSRFNVKPTAISGLTALALEEFDWKKDNGEIFLIVTPCHDRGYLLTTAFGIEGVADAHKKIVADAAHSSADATSFFILNASKLVREMDAELMK
jgi:hypothetical protein